MGGGSIGKLNDALFAELERLESIDAHDKEAVRQEVERAKAVTGLAGSITANHRLALEAARAQAGDMVASKVVVPKMLEG